jgi:hypothetical protein
MEGTMKKWTSILGLLIAGLAHGDTDETGLVLGLRQIDVRILESIGTIRLQLKVTNPTSRPLEGVFAFSAPVGAAVYEADVLKHIPSKARVSKVATPDFGEGLYAMDKQRILGGTEELAVAYLMHRSGHGDDPALVEQIAEDRYRVRFFPVPAGDDQTLTVLLAFEVPHDTGSFEVKIPLGYESNFRLGKSSRFETRIDLQSSDALAAVTSSTHRLDLVRKPQGSHQFWTVSDDAAGKPELALSYGLGAGARTIDVGSMTHLRVHPLATGEDRAACQALRSKRHLLSVAEAARPALGLSANLVSRYGSLLVMEDSLASILARDEGHLLRCESPSRVAVTKDEVLKCDFVRAAAQMPALSRSSTCELRAASTNDPAKIHWAQECGLIGSRTQAASSSASFEYVKHGRDCPLHEPSPEKLRLMVELLR